MRVKSADLARAAYNALAFWPASLPQWPEAMARVSYIPLLEATGIIRIQATDLVTAGVDKVAIAKGPKDAITLFIGRDALIQLDNVGRADKKGIGELTLTDKDGLIYSPFDSALTTVTAPSFPDIAMVDNADNVHRMIDELFLHVVESKPSDSAYICYDPRLLMRFSKVKTDKVERVADFFITRGATLVKIGPTFKGLIMPIDRDANRERTGDEGLWG